MKRQVFVSGDEDQFEVVITDTPRWLLAKEWIWDKLCVLTGGWLGGHGMPDKLWKIPVGRARWDHHEPLDPFLLNSVANLMCDLEQWVLGLGDNPWVRDRLMVRIPVSEEVARKLDPVYVQTWWEGEEDASQVTFDKGG